MDWIIPGTTLTEKREEAKHVEDQFHAMFLGGGIALGQVANITGLEPYTIQNWVKRGFLTKPEQKKYSLRQLCRILNINMLKSVLLMEDICELLGYINGDLSDEGDDLIDDSRLYFMFVRLAAQARYIGGTKTWDEALESVAAEYDEPVPGAREKLVKVLRIMLTAWVAAQLKFQTEKMMAELMDKT